MDRHSFGGDNRGQGEEPIFRSDLHERPEAPKYEPVRPEGGVWRTVKRLFAPLVAIGFLLTKFKFVLFALLKIKFVGTALTALLSIGAYALLFPLWFAVGLVALIWVHEMGHVLQLKREGIPASAPMFIPFLGALVAMKQLPKNALVEARVGLAGPVLGTLGALGVFGLYAWTQEPVLLALAYVGFFLNLINLLPVLPLDGGRAIGALSPAFWILGVGLMTALMFTSTISPVFLLLVAFLGGPELWRRWKTRNTPEGQAYHKIEPRQRFAVGLVYLVLAVSLALLMGVTEVPAPPAGRACGRLRTVLYTGKGGVGKTSVAAATALKAAASGKKVLVMSTDPAHSLSDAFDEPIGPEPREMAEGLYAQEMDQGTMIQDHWAEIQEYMTTFFEWQGTEALAAEELAMLPGMDEIFGLLMVRRHYEEGLYDALVVDAAPTGETLRLLSLPDQMGWYVEKIFPVQRRAAKLVRPFARRARTKSLPPLPEDSFFGALQRFYDSVAGVGEVLTDPETTSVRIVTNAEKMVVAESRRAYTYLNLYDYAVDAVVVNRLLPDSVSDPYFEGWQQAQARHLESIEEAFSPLPIFKAKLFDREMYGMKALGALAEEIFGDEDPLRHFSRGPAHDIVKADGGYEVVLNLPLVEKGSVDLSKKGAELLVRVGSYRRNVLLPDSMVRLRAAGARIDGDKLRIRLADG